MTWVGSGENEGESFHVCFSAAQCWRGTVAEQGSAWSASCLIKHEHELLNVGVSVFSLVLLSSRDKRDRTLIGKQAVP